MHEVGVVSSLVQQVEAEARRLGVAGRVTAVHLKLGALTTFVPAAMTFCFDALTRGTDLAGAKLVIEEIPAAANCRSCGAAFTLASLPFACAACGSPDIEITAGRELLLDALEVDDEAPR